MTEPQVWPLIGVFTTIMLGGMTLSTTLVMRATTSAIGGLRGELKGDIGGLRGELRGAIGRLDAKIEGLRGEMNARFDTVDRRLEHLDRDVAHLMRREWGESAPE
ncbi:MAG: hypothetical protein QM622_11185 [Microbacterium sp.]